jgi:sporulation protein YabP
MVIFINEKNTVFLSNKEDLKITGINKIISLDSTHFTLETNLGTLRILGQNLEMIFIDSNTKIINIKGIIEEISYKKIIVPKESLIKKILK